MFHYVFILLGVIFVILFVLSKKKAPSSPSPKVVEDKQPDKKNLGEIQVFYASQTGTAAKMASNFAEEAAEYGFTGIVLSLKDISHE